MCWRSAVLAVALGCTPARKSLPERLLAAEAGARAVQVQPLPNCPSFPEDPPLRLPREIQPIPNYQLFPQEPDPRPRSPPFDRAVVLSTLATIASALQSCKTAGGPTGEGRVRVLFDPSGAAIQARVDGVPFEATATGACIAAKFSAARIPRFEGCPIRVQKSFVIE
jgi:hypothetical protein